MNFLKLDARILQAVDPKNTDKVLEIEPGPVFLPHFYLNYAIRFTA